MLKGEDQLTKRKYVRTITNATTTATFSSFTTPITIAPTTTSIATNCNVKSIEMKISRSI